MSTQLSDEDRGEGEATWEPRWWIEDRTGAVVGLCLDDGCYVVLYPHGDGWRPGTHIPPAVAAFIAELVTGERERGGQEK